MLIPAVATFSCLFCEVQGFCVKCQSTFTAFSHVILVWCLSIVIDRCASSDQSPVPMLVKVHCVSCLGLMGVVVLCQFVTLCVYVAHNVCVVLRSSLMFLVFFCYMMMGRKVIIVILSPQ